MTQQELYEKRRRIANERQIRRIKKRQRNYYLRQENKQ